MVEPMRKTEPVRGGKSPCDLQKDCGTVTFIIRRSEMRITYLYLSTKKALYPSVQYQCGHFFVSDGIPEWIFGGRAPHITDSVCRYFWITTPHTHIVHTRAYCTYLRIWYIPAHTVHTRALYILVHTVHTRAHCTYPHTVHTTQQMLPVCMSKTIIVLS